MARRKVILLLGFGWALMLAGALLLMDAGLRYRPEGSSLPALESSGGFAVAVTGWLLRRTVVARAAKPGNDSGAD